MLEELGELIRRGGKIDLVTAPKLELTGGDDGLSLPGNGADQHPDPDVPVQVAEPQAVQSGILGQAVLHQLQPALGEGLQLHGRRKPQHAGDLPGGGLFRVNGHGEAQFLPHEAKLRLILRIADTGDGVPHAQLLRHQARQNIQFVAGDRGDQQVRPANLRFLLHLVAGAVAADAHDVVDVDDIFNDLLVFVNDRHPVLGGKLLRQRKTHLTGAHDNDIHRPFS